MLKVNTSSSTNENSKLAGQEAAKKLKECSSPITMAYAYASCDYDLKEMMVGIKTELPDAQIIGNTSFSGVITPEGYISGEKGFIGMMGISDDEMKVGIAGVEKGDSAIKDGEKVAKLAMEKAGKTCPPDYYYMVASPGEEEFYVKGITNVIGRVPFYGGSAADNSIEGKWKLYTDAEIIADGVAVAFFYTNKEQKNVFTGAYKETDDVGIITKVDGDRVLVEIDGVPALDKYAQWRDMERKDVLGGNLLAETITSPLGVKDPLGDLIVIRHPMNGNEDGSMNVGNKLAENTALIRMEAAVDELINSVGETLSELKERMGESAAAYHLVHCGGRRVGIDNRIDEVYEQIKKEVGDIPFIVEFTFGEYGCEADGINACGGLMLSFTGFGK